MSDEWIFSVKSLTFGALLALSVLKFEVQTVELASGNSLQELSPQQVVQLQILQDYQDLTHNIPESAKLEHPDDVVKNPSPESPDQAQLPQGKDESPIKLVEEMLEDIEDVVEPAIEIEEEKERADETTRTAEREQGTAVDIGGPKVEAEIAEIIELQDQQKKERDDLAAKLAESRDKLAEKYADSPEQEKHLKEFDKAAEKADDTLARRQDAQLQKLQEQQLQRSSPPDPSHDR